MTTCTLLHGTEEPEIIFGQNKTTYALLRVDNHSTEVLKIFHNVKDVKDVWEWIRSRWFKPSNPFPDGFGSNWSADELSTADELIFKIKEINDLEILCRRPAYIQLIEFNVDQGVDLDDEDDEEEDDQEETDQLDTETCVTAAEPQGADENPIYLTHSEMMTFPEETFIRNNMIRAGFEVGDTCAMCPAGSGLRSVQYYGHRQPEENVVPISKLFFELEKQKYSDSFIQNR